LGGSPRPLNETVICTGQSKGFALFQSTLNDSKMLIIGDDAEYFNEGKEYTVAFVPVNSSDSVGNAGKKPSSS
jgi:hypothetical protein